MNEVYVDHERGAVIINDTGLTMDDVMPALRAQPEIAALVKWTSETRPGRSGSVTGRAGSLFERDRYVTPENPYDQMRVAYEAAESDDVVGSVLDSTESLAFGRMQVETDDPDEEDIWNQIAEDLDVSSRMREIWREKFITSNTYVAVWWGTKSYKVRGKNIGVDGVARQRKKTFQNLIVPTGISVLDPLRILPVGGYLLNQERLCYIADWTEKDVIDSWLMGGDASGVDPIVQQLVVGKFIPDLRDRKQIGNLGVDPNRLFLMNPANIYRETPTRSNYDRFASVRLKSVFEILDMKHQLRQMDRAHLIGAPLRVDQRIATPDGWKPIGAARVGDKVFSVDGKPTEIIGVFPQGVLSGMRKVTFTDGAEVVCDLKHPWTVADRFGHTRTIPLSNIVEEGLFDPNGPGKRVHRHRIPIAAPLELPEAPLPLDPYLVGYMLGDGSLTQSIPKITCAEPETDQPWRDVLPAGVTVSQYETRDGFCPQYGLKGSRWRHNEVTEGLRACGVWGMVDEDKFIPDEYLWASVEQRWALLCGLCDSDGHSHQAGGVEFSTVSEKLALGVVQLAQSLGGVAKISERRGTVDEPVAFDIAPCCAERPAQIGYSSVAEGWCSHCGAPLVGVAVATEKKSRTLYRVWVSLHQTEAPFRLRRKVEKWRPRKVAYVRAVAKIEPTVDAEAICIKTARDDGLFLTEGMVVTHNTNFIVLIKKGSKDRPAQQTEVDALQASMRTLARVPVIVGDDRLNVEIITPKTDQTLNSERYAGLDIRISGRLYGMFITAKSRGDDSIKLARVVARGLEDKRDQQRRNFMRYVLKPCYERNSQFTSPATLRFYPKRIALDFDPALATYLLDLRDRGDLSRDSILAEIDYDEADEARKREYEAEHFDHIFQTEVPFSGGGGGGPAAANPVGPGGPKLALPPAPPQVPGRAGGRTGGNRGGGGRAPGSGQGQAARTAKPKNPTGPRARAALETAPPERVLSQRTRAHAAAAAVLRDRRAAVEDAVDDAVEEALAAQLATLQARHAEEIDALRAEHETLLAEQDDDDDAPEGVTE